MERQEMKALLDALEWRKLPEPDEPVDDLPYPTHEAELKIGELRLRCYMLSDGERIINAEDMAAFFETL